MNVNNGCARIKRIVKALPSISFAKMFISILRAVSIDWCFQYKEAEIRPGPGSPWSQSSCLSLGPSPRLLSWRLGLIISALLYHRSKEMMFLKVLYKWWCFRQMCPQKHVLRINMFQAVLSLPILLLWRDPVGLPWDWKGQHLGWGCNSALEPVPSR